MNTKIKQKDKKNLKIRCLNCDVLLFNYSSSVLQIKVLYYYKIMVIVINTNLTYVTNRFSCIVIK